VDDDKRLRTALQAIMAARRDELGEPPRPDELLAYRDGALPPAERALVEEKIAAFPEAAAALLDLASFPNVRPTAGVREVTDEEIAADWQSLQARMETKARPVRASSRSFGSWRQAAALIAAVLLAALGGVLVGRGPLAPPARPAAGADLLVLEPEGSPVTRGEVATIDPLRPHLLVLSAGGVQPLASYSLTIHDAGGRLIWRDTEVIPTAQGLVTVQLPERFLAPGHYRIGLSPPDGDEPLATFALSVEVDDRR
jgi:hypothetical protein